MILKFKNNYQASEETIPNPPLDLFSGSISNTTLEDPVNGCNILTLVDNVYIKQQYISYITNGDLVFYDNTETLPFVGNDEYYKIKASNSLTYIVTVTPLGVVTNNYAICTP